MSKPIKVVIRDRDLDLLTNRELYLTAKELGLVYKGRNNAIDDIRLKLPLVEAARLPRQIRNLVISKLVRDKVTNIYDVINVLKMSDADTKIFANVWQIKADSIVETRCDVIKILTFAGKVPESDIILVMHPNFDEVCSQLAGPDFQTKLIKLATELGISLTAGDGVEKAVKVLLLEILDRLPIKEPSDIDWSQLLNFVLARPQLITDSFKYFGKWSVFNQLYLLTQLSIEAGMVQPVATVIEWRKIGGTVTIGERAYSLAVPVAGTSGNMIYSASIFLYQQTNLNDRKIKMPGIGFDISKLLLKLKMTDFDQVTLINIAKLYLIFSIPRAL